MFFTLVYKNIIHNRFKYLFIFFITFVINLSIFASNAFVDELKVGIDTVRNRLGADLVIMPKDADIDIEAVLFHGKPVSILMSNKYSENIRDIDSVNQVAKRLYLATLEGQSCCDDSIQLIATNIAEDFLLNPYTKIKELNTDEIILGYKFNVKVGDTVKYFGRKFIVKDKLEKTNTGIDLSGFISFSAAREIINDPVYHNEYFADYTDDSISLLFVKTDNSYLVNNVVKSRYGNVLSVYVPDKKIADYTKSVALISKVITAVNMVLIIVGLLSIICITLVTTELRRNEYGSLLLIGYTNKKIMLLFSLEEIIVTLFATFCALIIYLPVKNECNAYISKMLDLPVVNSLNAIFIFTILLITTGISVLAVFISIHKLIKTPAAILIKESN